MYRRNCYNTFDYVSTAGDLCCSVFELNLIPSKADREQASLTALCTVLVFSESNNAEKCWNFLCQITKQLLRLPPVFSLITKCFLPA